MCEMAARTYHTICEAFREPGHHITAAVNPAVTPALDGRMQGPHTADVQCTNMSWDSRFSGAWLLHGLLPMCLLRLPEDTQQYSAAL